MLDEQTRRACGLTALGLQACGADGLLMPETGKALGKLKRRAQRQGFDMRVASSFRDYHHQLRIFNAKARGQRPVTDDHDRLVDPSALSPQDYLLAILRFSALPGTSRHHWGTDIDVWNAAAVAADYSLQLSMAEYAPSGPFGEFSSWLRARVDADDAEGFYLPYATDTGGVAPEPWHLSYRADAAGLAERQTREVLEPLWSGSFVQSAEPPVTEPLALLTIVRPQIDALLMRYLVS